MREGRPIPPLPGVRRARLARDIRNGSSAYIRSAKRRSSFIFIFGIAKALREGSWRWERRGFLRAPEVRKKGKLDPKGRDDYERLPRAGGRARTKDPELPPEIAFATRSTCSSERLRSRQRPTIPRPLASPARSERRGGSTMGSGIASCARSPTTSADSARTSPPTAATSDQRCIRARPPWQPRVRRLDGGPLLVRERRGRSYADMPFPRLIRAKADRRERDAGPREALDRMYLRSSTRTLARGVLRVGMYRGIMSEQARST
jgi:hypothetical protein